MARIGNIIPPLVVLAVVGCRAVAPGTALLDALSSQSDLLSSTGNVKSSSAVQVAAFSDDRRDNDDDGHSTFGTDDARLDGDELPEPGVAQKTVTAARLGPPAAGSAPPSDRAIRLNEAIGIALSNSDVVRTVDGRAVTTAAATAFDPVIAGRRIAVERAAFDPLLEVEYRGSQFDEPDNSSDPFRQARGNQRDETEVLARVSKRWSPGTTTSIAYQPPLAYLYRPDADPDEFNPQTSAAVVLEARQPLLRGAGRTVNVAPIRIARLRTDQSVWELKRDLIAQVRSIEEAYWNLQAAVASFQAIEKVLPLLDEAVRIEELRLKEELVTEAEVARLRLQRSEFRQERIRLAADVQEQQYILRTLMGSPLDDDELLVPVDPPAMNAALPELRDAVSTAVEHRPDVVLRRLQVRVREIELDVAANRQRPQFDLQALYRLSGLDDRIEDAFEQLERSKYTDWTVGLVFSVPLGNRAATANRRAAEQQLMRERALYRQQVRNVTADVATVLNDLRATRREYREAASRVRDGEEWVRTARLRFRAPPPAGESQDWLIVAINEYQSALRRNVDALVDSARSLSRYNSLLARLGEAQGTLLEERAIELGEDPVREVQEHSADWFDDADGE